MKPLKIILLLTFGVSFKAHSEITKSLTEIDDCKILIHAGCGSDMSPKGLANISAQWKKALQEGPSGFNDVTLANIDHPIYNYNCRQSKYPPAKPGALVREPLKAAKGSLTRPQG